MFIKRLLIILIFISLNPVILIYSQGFPTNILELEPKLSALNVKPGSEIDFALMVEIDPEFHINAHEPNDEFLIPTILKFETLENVSFGRIIYPYPKMAKFPFSDEALAVYKNTFVIFSKVQINGNHQLGELKIKGALSYQACNDQNCFAPEEKSFEVDLNVVDIPENTENLNQDIFSKIPKPDELSNVNAEFTADEMRAKAVLEKGLPYALIAFFLFGLALNLTPCVYPVIPLTVGYFGGQSARRKGSSFIIALFYVIGIAVIFAGLGLISSLAGKQWGFLFQDPWFVITISIIILAMAASMFGAFEIKIPSGLMNKLGKSREGVIGAFIMGLTVGVVIAPCAAGIIIGLVGLVAKLGIVIKGTLLFFIMGLGLGLPYLILATFSSLLNKIPQSGMWMVWVRKFFGILLVGVALYFLLPQAKHIYNQQGFYFGILAIFGGLLLGFLDDAQGYTKSFKIGRAIFGVLLILWGISSTNAAIHSKPSEIGWIHYKNESIEEFAKLGKPIIIDFYADWCAPCKQMDKTTFENKQVVEKAKQFSMLKVDCTAPDDNINAFINKFEVTGKPTFIFIDKDGNEKSELREIGYVKYDKFLEKMELTLQ